METKQNLRADQNDLELRCPVIPRWVISQLEPSPELLRDIGEINQGMYGPGYQSVVKMEGPPTTETVTRKISWRRPDRVSAARTLKLKRRSHGAYPSEILEVRTCAH